MLYLFVLLSILFNFLYIKMTFDPQNYYYFGNYANNRTKIAKFVKKCKIEFAKFAYLKNIS